MGEVRKGRIDPSRFVPIVGDAALAGSVADGKLLPVLIIDVSDRPDAVEVLRQHQHLASGGDAQHQWATSRDNTDRVVLLLEFLRPSEVDLVLPFSIERQGILVDSMIRAGAVYLQAGSKGDRLMNTFEAPRVLVELPDTGFATAWESIFEEQMTRVMAARMGVSRKKARPAAQAVILELRKFAAMRFGGQK